MRNLSRNRHKHLKSLGTSSEELSRRSKLNRELTSDESSNSKDNSADSSDENSGSTGEILKDILRDSHELNRSSLKGSQKEKSRIKKDFTENDHKIWPSIDSTEKRQELLKLLDEDEEALNNRKNKYVKNSNIGMRPRIRSPFRSLYRQREIDGNKKRSCSLKRIKKSPVDRFEQYKQRSDNIGLLSLLDPLENSRKKDQESKPAKSIDQMNRRRMTSPFPDRHSLMNQERSCHYKQSSQRDVSPIESYRLRHPSLFGYPNFIGDPLYPGTVDNKSWIKDFESTTKKMEDHLKDIPDLDLSTADDRDSKDEESFTDDSKEDERKRSENSYKLMEKMLKKRSDKRFNSNNLYCDR
ncbi:MAG: hypothetical protein MHPSP_001091 [Paramarteilia canceri]